MRNEHQVRLKKDGTPDQRQFRYKWFGYDEKPGKPSTRASRQLWLHEHKGSLRDWNRQWRSENRAKLTIDKRDYWNKIRAEVLDAYGNKCQCCGESDVRFLTLDHVNGRTTTGKSSTGKKITGKKSMAEAKRLGFPRDKFQILCFNCNCAKGIYGMCPHQLRKKEENEGQRT